MAWFIGDVELVAVKLPEAGILEVEFEVAGDSGAVAPRPCNRMLKGEKFTRRLREDQRVLVSLEGVLVVPWAHVVGETFTGQGLDADPVCRMALQFAVGASHGELLVQIALRLKLDGYMEIQERQLELEMDGHDYALLELHSKLNEWAPR